jgi:RNA polymerase sigma-70 factor (ECF subfamily)
MSTGDPLADSERSEADGSDTGEGHRRTFAELYRESRESLIRVLRPRCRTRDEAEDVLHEAVVKLFALDQPGTYSFLSSLLYRTAVNVVKNRRKQEVTYARLNPIAVKGPDEFAPPPEDALDEQQFAKRLPEALNALKDDNPKWSEAFLLRTQHNLEWKEISKRMGVTTRMTEFYVARAVEYCQNHIDAKVTRRKPK